MTTVEEAKREYQDALIIELYAQWELEGEARKHDIDVKPLHPDMESALSWLMLTKLWTREAQDKLLFVEKEGGV